MIENTIRPPTPMGWSDTDWLKHFQEWKERQVCEEFPHPLATLHINQGSWDAAADFYEAAYTAEVCAEKRQAQT